MEGETAASSHRECASRCILAHAISMYPRLCYRRAFSRRELISASLSPTVTRRNSYLCRVQMRKQLVAEPPKDLAESFDRFPTICAIATR